jgi:FAD/FMN-containing dehydrogenase
MPSQPPIRGTYRTDERARAAYAEGAGIYRIVPRAVARPRDADDVCALVRWAAAERVPLVPRGAGSAMGGGNVGDGVVVDLTTLAPRMLVVDAAARRARAAAPITLRELNAAASQHGLRLPPDPSSGRWATLAGMLSTNAAGARSVRYGSVRRWVEGATMITADGEPVELTRKSGDGGRRDAFPPVSAINRFERDAAPAIHAAADLVRERFPKTRKNSSGYALDAWLASGELIDLVIGAEGTLGIVVESRWRLDPIPRWQAGLRVSLASAAALGDAVPALLACDPSALELLDRSFLELVLPTLPAELRAGIEDAEAVLLVELERDQRAALRLAVEEATAAVRPWALAVETALGGEAAERLWALRHAASPILAALPDARRSLQVIEDGCVPIDRLGAYVAAVRRLAQARGIPAVLFGHAGDGHVHVNLLPEIARAGWERDVAALLDEVTAVVADLGGTPSGEHGDGRLRAALLERIYGADVVALFGRVKDAFDPLGILNPGVIVPEPSGAAAGCATPIARLKTGADATPLPSDIAAALRAIEKGGGYAQDRLAIADGRSG